MYIEISGRIEYGEDSTSGGPVPTSGGLIATWIEEGMTRNGFASAQVDMSATAVPDLVDVVLKVELLARGDVVRRGEEERATVCEVRPEGQNTVAVRFEEGGSTHYARGTEIAVARRPV